jgi:hypothetical protein
MSVEKVYHLSELELHRLIQEAATCGAKKALADIGLHDEQAAADIRDMRSLIDGYRIARKGFLSAFGKIIAVGVLALLALGVYIGEGKIK